MPAAKQRSRRKKTTPARAPSEEERERALDWRSRFANQGGYGASSSYGAYTGAFGFGGWGGHGGSGGHGGESGTAGYGGRGTGSYGGSADRIGDMTTPDRRRSQQGFGEYGAPERGRPDARILADVRKLLAEQDEADASAVQVHVEDGAVTLAGTVRTRAEGRALAALVANVRGVTEVTDATRIERAPRTKRPAEARRGEGRRQAVSGASARSASGRSRAGAGARRPPRRAK